MLFDMVTKNRPLASKTVKVGSIIGSAFLLILLGLAL